jgi:hypothetical protein
MRARFVCTLAVISAAALVGCADDPPMPAARAAGAVPPPQGAPNGALLARLRADDPALLQAAQAIVASRDLVTLRAASARLAAEAQTARTPQTVAPLLPAMEAIGGPDVVAFCLWLGENEYAPLELRKGALAVLVRWADRNDPAVRTRSTRIWERVGALSSGGAAVAPSGAPAVAPAGAPAVAPAGAPAVAPEGAPAVGGTVRGPGGSVSIGSASIRGGTIPNADTVIAGMAGDFRRCHATALQADAATHGTLRVTVRVEVAGGVVVIDESHEGLTPALVSCVITRVQSATFAPPQGGAATVVIPIAFEARP